MHLLAFIIFGLIVGAIAKLLMPGRDPGGFIVTALLGMAGALLGGWVGRNLLGRGEDYTAGWILAIIGALVLLAIYHFATRGRRTTTI